jgi:hypothetical protein
MAAKIVQTNILSFGAGAIVKTTGCEHYYSLNSNMPNVKKRKDSDSRKRPEWTILAQGRFYH